MLIAEGNHVTSEGNVLTSHAKQLMREVKQPTSQGDKITSPVS